MTSLVVYACLYKIISLKRLTNGLEYKDLNQNFRKKNCSLNNEL